MLIQCDSCELICIFQSNVRLDRGVILLMISVFLALSVPTNLKLANPCVLSVLAAQPPKTLVCKSVRCQCQYSVSVYSIHNKLTILYNNMIENIQQVIFITCTCHETKYNAEISMYIGGLFPCIIYVAFVYRGCVIRPMLPGYSRPL